MSQHLVTPSTSFVLPYSIHVADRIIHDAEPRGTETMTVAQILARSSNVGAITLAERLGQHALAGWISRFGFGRRTGIDFPGESPGIALKEKDWSGSTIGNVPIGQGISVTPVQLAAAYSAIANRGVWIRPHLVDHIGDGASVRAARHRIVSRSVARSLLSMLKNVVLDGTGTLAAVPGYQVAGKTGTASKVDPDGTYSRLALRRLVRRGRARVAAAPRHPRRGRRAARRDLGRRRSRRPRSRRSRSSTCSTWTEGSPRTLRPPCSRLNCQNCRTLRYVVPLAIAWHDRPTLLVAAVLVTLLTVGLFVSVMRSSRGEPAPSTEPHADRRRVRRPNSAIRVRRSRSSATRSPQHTTRGR